MDLPKFSKAMYVYLITYTQRLFNPFFYDLWRSYQDQLELQLLYFRVRGTFFLLLIILQKRFFFENCMHVQGFFYTVVNLIRSDHLTNICLYPIYFKAFVIFRKESRQSLYDTHKSSKCTTV